MDSLIRCACPSCGRKLRVSDRMAGKSGQCPSCGAGFTIPSPDVIELDEPDLYTPPTYPPVAAYTASPAPVDPGKGLIVGGYLCGGLSLILLPPGLGLAGIVIGVVNLTKGRVGHGIAQIVIAATCGFFGMILGAASMS